eukprot:2441513-Alexandrium_andersonii.AAC.1
MCARDPHSAGPGARGAARSAAPPAPGSEAEGLRLSPTRSRGEGLLARWACWGRRPPGLDFGPRAHFDQTPK